ncbi:MAG TPA: MarR family transcriptional regulator [Planctomycetota bacterium]|nr:MarR family transcriptional regulator [Planctomycetota bacterium]
MVGRLLTELKQTKPFRTRENETFLNLVRTTELLRREVIELFKPHDLTHAQYNVLRILRGALRESEPQHQARTCGDIASRLVTFEPDVTRLLDKLERQGLIVRKRNNADHRVVRSRITDKNLALLTQLNEPIAETQRRRLGRLGQERLATLIDLLEELRS